MTKKKKIGIIAFFALLILLLIVAIIQNVSSKGEEEITYETAIVEKQEPILTDGKVMPAKTKEYTYNPQKGEITSISIKDGQSVEAGQELFRYKNESIENQLADAKTTRTRLYNALEENTKQLDKLKKAQEDAPDPATQLNTTPLPTSNEAVQGNQGAMQTLETTISDLKNQINDAETQITRLQKQATTIITAGVDGTVLLDASLKENAATPFLRIITDDTLIQSSISEYDYYTLSQDLEVGIYVNAEDREVKGVVTDIAETAQTPTGLANAEATSFAGGGSGAIDMSNFEFFVKPQKEIHYDFTVQIQIPLKDIVIPEGAIQKEKDQEYVFVVRDGKAQKQIIQREKRGLQNVVVEGLQLKDVIVTNPDEQLKDGMEISTATEGESTSQ